jgi:ABC-type nitrate/sulfonate/bicarbonate transport system substrate-binding protein
MEETDMKKFTRAAAALALAALPFLAAAQSGDRLVALSAGNTTPLAPIYLAETLGYAQQEGLSLTVKTVYANSLNLVVAGEGDLSVIGVSSALVPVREGKETSIVYAISSGLGTGQREVDRRLHARVHLAGRLGRVLVGHGLQGQRRRQVQHPGAG